MKGFDLADGALVVGLGLLAAGVYLVAGLGWCLMVLGALLLAGWLRVGLRGS